MSSIYAPGRIVGGRYRIVSALSQGGMGAVYLAQQVSLGRDVALKVMLERDQDPELTKRFDVEARAVCLLKHPNIITYHDYGRDEEGHPFLVMEFLPGYAGTKLVYGERKCSVTDLVHIVAQVCSALHEAHVKGIIHRDLKWSNVMICPQSHDPYFAKLIDFGIMKMATDGSSGDQRQLTVTGMLLGTPEYMSPEAICGMPIDGRADQYSLGIMLWEALEGGRPFAASVQFELLRMQVQEPPPPFEAARAVMDQYPQLEAVVLRAIEKHPDDRFESILAFRDALLQATGHVAGRGGVAARPLPGRSSPTEPRGGAGRPTPGRPLQPVPKSQAGPSSGARLPAPREVQPAPVDTSHRTGTRGHVGEARARWPLLALAGLLLAGGGAAIAVMATSGGTEPAAAQAGADVTVAATTAPTVGAGTADAGAVSVPPAADSAAVAAADPGAGEDARVAGLGAWAPQASAVEAMRAGEDAGPTEPSPLADAAGERVEAVREAADTIEPPADTVAPIEDAAQAVVVDAIAATRGDARAPAPVAMGSVRLQAIPWANVTINGKPYGRTPVVTDLKAGRVKVVFEYPWNPAETRKRIETVVVKAGETTTKVVDMSH